MRRRGASPEPITPDIELFGDNACTVYPNGSLSTIYARINKAWSGVGSGWSAVDGVYQLEAGAPTQDNPDGRYDIEILVNGGAAFFMSEQVSQPFPDGFILPLEGDQAFTFDGSPIVFYNPKA